MNPCIPDEDLRKFIKSIPKSDIHVHIDGSIRINTLFEIAKKDKIKLPYDSKEGLEKHLFLPKYKDLNEFLKAFKVLCSALQSKENLERVSYEFAVDSYEDHVHYVEARFCPQLHINPNMNMVEVLLSVDKGLKRATEEYNSKEAAKNGEIPSYNYCIIPSVMREIPKGLSWYYDNFIKIHEFSPIARISAIASYELVLAIIKIKKEYKLPIAGIDMAGREIGFPPSIHKETFNLAKKEGFHRTVHIEEEGAPAIHEAISECSAERIGIGMNLLDWKRIFDPKIKEPQKFVNWLINIIEEEQIVIEVCISRYLQTNPKLTTPNSLPIREMLKHNLPVAICTDDRFLSKTCLSQELEIAYKSFKLTLKELKDIIFTSFNGMFYNGKHKEKIEFIQKCREYYDKLENGLLNKLQNNSSNSQLKK